MLQLKNVQHDFDVAVGDIGVTVRKGTKWADTMAMQSTDEGVIFTNQRVDLWQCPKPHDGECLHAAPHWCDRRGTAVLVGAWVGQLIDIPPRLLALEHEEESREFKGLCASLARAYGDMSVTAAVTALIYLRLTTGWRD